MLELRLTEYDEAWISVVRAAVDRCVGKEAFFGRLQRVTSSHQGPIRNVRGDQPLDHSLTRFEMRANLEASAVCELDVGKHSEFLADLARAHLEQTAPRFFDVIDEITDAAGQAINANGKPFSWDLWLDMIEKLELAFDENGEPLMPTMVIHPSMRWTLRSMPVTVDNEIRFMDIIEAKRVEYFKSKRSRRLSQNTKE